MKEQETIVLEKFRKLAEEEAKNIQEIFTGYSSFTQRITFRHNIHKIHYGYFMGFSEMNSTFGCHLDPIIIDREMYKITDEIIEKYFPKEND